MSDDWEDDANPFGMQSPPSAKTQNCGLRPGQPFGQTKGSTLGRSQPPVHKPTGYNGVSESSNILKNNSISQSSTPRTVSFYWLHFLPFCCISRHETAENRCGVFIINQS